MSKSKWKLIGIIALFVVPYIFAVIAYRNRAVWFSKTTNNGELILPVTSLKEIDSSLLDGKWKLVYVAANNCAKACKQNIYNLQQIRIALGKKLLRVGSLVINLQTKSAPKFTPWLVKNFPGTHVVYVRPELWQNVYDFTNKANNKEIFIVDPIGNLVLAYAGGTASKPIYQDLQKLLKASQIG